MIATPLPIMKMKLKVALEENERATTKTKKVIKERIALDTAKKRTPKIKCDLPIRLGLLGVGARVGVGTGEGTGVAETGFKLSDVSISK